MGTTLHTDSVIALSDRQQRENTMRANEMYWKHKKEIRFGFVSHYARWLKMHEGFHAAQALTCANVRFQYDNPHDAAELATAMEGKYWLTDNQPAYMRPHSIFD